MVADTLVIATYIFCLPLPALVGVTVGTIVPSDSRWHKVAILWMLVASVAITASISFFAYRYFAETSSLSAILGIVAVPCVIYQGLFILNEEFDE